MISGDPQLCHTRLTLAFEEQKIKNFPLIWSDLPWGCRGMAHMDITRNDDRFPARSACSQWHWYDGASWVLGWKPKENQWAYDSRVICPRGPKVMANYKPWRYKSEKEKIPLNVKILRSIIIKEGNSTLYVQSIPIILCYVLVRTVTML